MTTPTSTQQTTPAYVIVLDGSDLTRRLALRLLDDGQRCTAVSCSTHDVVEFTAARWRAHVWPVVADPTDPLQMREVIGRTERDLGPVEAVIDPAGQVPDGTLPARRHANGDGPG